ncbi:hypothetical protein TSOC_002777 [Tetrabaena socialis]|uniref:Uncharacterized protein n=1 Tax=Tetrabaena socialis TaxID=47790 RepID=A0A2J8AD82_9CHLO|nr:hypothetical protein TSOC_002777 [Tetrabaena socialis]|eukprot:PNH10469.1 hypothetical protein TSOC_002777 [Tetrabaena socialis]
MPVSRAKHPARIAQIRGRGRGQAKVTKDKVEAEGRRAEAHNRAVVLEMFCCCTAASCASCACCSCTAAIAAMAAATASSPSPWSEPCAWRCCSTSGGSSEGLSAEEGSAESCGLGARAAAGPGPALPPRCRWVG